MLFKIFKEAGFSTAPLRRREDLTFGLRFLSISNPPIAHQSVRFSASPGTYSFPPAV
jgi:hypothetical protein